MVLFNQLSMNANTYGVLHYYPRDSLVPRSSEVSQTRWLSLHWGIHHQLTTHTRWSHRHADRLRTPELLSLLYDIFTVQHTGRCKQTHTHSCGDNAACDFINQRDYPQWLRCMVTKLRLFVCVWKRMCERLRTRMTVQFECQYVHRYELRGLMVIFNMACSSSVHWQDYFGIWQSRCPVF